MIPNNVRTVRLTAAAGTNLARTSFEDRSNFYFLPSDSGLQPEGLHPARGVARSDFRPLPKILDCSHPEVSGQCLSPSEPGHALTPGNHLCLGKPLPHQQANSVRARPQAPEL